MNCSEAEQFFDAFLDDELSGSLRLEFDVHRLRCSVCQQKLAMMEACEHILSRDSQAPAPSAGFTNRVMNEIGERRLIAHRTRRRRLVVAAAVALQAAAVLTFAVVWWGHQRPASPTLGNDGFVDVVGEAIDGRDKVKLTELIFLRAEDRLIAAGSNIKTLKDELGDLTRYASSLSILGDLSSFSDTTLSPWPLPILAPAAAEEAEPASSATGPFSL